MYKFNIILWTVEKGVMDSAASWILKTKEYIKLPQSTLKKIIDVTSPFQFVHDIRISMLLRNIGNHPVLTRPAELLIGSF